MGIVKYRIVTDKRNGFQPQYKRWYFPFYKKFGGVLMFESFNSERLAMEFIESHKKIDCFKSVVVSETDTETAPYKEKKLSLEGCADGSLVDFHEIN